ncbi:alpha/beta hydrolase [Bradyrhizobium hipponense]|uniref:Alpha/beta hydrolase n=1 Tax=Bradyrhizobium hipponense TaxID=2605638 RepID=A0A5S4YIU6_9BRAD|nr:alpha/beta hydrolase [Bradyrhizobium hipponense]TYO63932.1 alpha/beta hydrolase [Bradyrhizobium hipponense]
MATFVLIPGGWRGGWTFAEFVARLNRSGHEAAAVALSGLHAEHERSAAPINLDTHIADVLDLLRLKDLSEVILCSHSYGGMVASGVADRAPERIAALVYLDAFVPEHGQSWWDLAGEHFRNLAIDRARHDGLSVLPPEGGDPRRRPHPLGSFLQAVHLPRAPAPMPRVFVYASGWSATPFTAQYQRLRDDPAWIVHSLACGHDVINAAPDEIFEILMQTAARLATT